MLAVRLLAPQQVEVVETEIPVPRAGEVLLRVGGAGICHSDLHVVRSPHRMFQRPLTLGHETAGHIAELGPDVRGWSVGDAAVVHLCWSCGVCRACAAGRDNVCESTGRRAQPPTPGLGPDGGMAEYMRVPARYLVPMGALDPVTAAPLADAGTTSYHAIRNSARVLTPGSTALVIGVGGLGHLAVQILRELTGAQVIAVDVAPDKLATARAHGADHTVVAGPAAAGTVLELTGGRGADAVFDFVGNDATTTTAVHTIAPDGIYQISGLGGGRPDIAAEPRDGRGWPWGASLRTSYGGTRSDLVHCLALAQRGRISVAVRTFPLTEAPTAFAELEAGNIEGRAVLVP